MKNIYFILAAAASVAFASCTSDELVGGENQGTEQSLTGDAIVFGSNAGKLTRATSNTGTVAEMLDGQMKIYGVKGDPDKTTNPKYTTAFGDYILWNSGTTSISNPDADWEYVGPATQEYGSDTPKKTIGQNQTTKYWDYSAKEYHFVAGSPVSSFTFTTDATTGDIATATVTGLGGHINANDGTPEASSFSPVYIAKPVIVKKANYKQDVEFTFVRQQTFVRVGIFETIPGYSIKSIEFYTQGATGWEAPTGDHKNNIILASTTANYFSGAAIGNATINYVWTGTGAPTYTLTYGSGLTQQKNWYGGKLANGVEATASTESTITKLFGTDKDMSATTGYFPVIPMDESATAQPILVRCNYTLLSEDGQNEEITVTGATAAIPAAFSKWNANTTYTYIFKISPDTNGTTGTEGSDPEGLFPITFDAVVTGTADGTAQGTITSVSTPSITTYQEESVVDQTTPSEVHGIKYVKDKPIYLTAQNDETGILNTLFDGGTTVGAVQVFSLGTTAKTEADLQLAAPTGTSLFTLGSTATTVAGVSFEANKYGSFTPNAAGYYAIQYLITATSPVAYTYKIVYVAE